MLGGTAEDGDVVGRGGIELGATEPDPFDAAVGARRTVTVVTVTRLPEEGVGDCKDEDVGPRRGLDLGCVGGRYIAEGLNRAPKRMASSRVFCIKDLGCDGTPPVGDSS